LVKTLGVKRVTAMQVTLLGTINSPTIGYSDSVSTDRAGRLLGIIRIRLVVAASINILLNTRQLLNLLRRRNG
jgi:hypothetical protein